MLIETEDMKEKLKSNQINIKRSYIMQKESRNVSSIQTIDMSIYYLKDMTSYYCNPNDEKLKRVNKTSKYNKLIEIQCIFIKFCVEVIFLCHLWTINFKIQLCIFFKFFKRTPQPPETSFDNRLMKFLNKWCKSECENSSSSKRLL